MACRWSIKLHAAKAVPEKLPDMDNEGRPFNLKLVVVNFNNAVTLEPKKLRHLKVCRIQAIQNIDIVNLRSGPTLERCSKRERGMRSIGKVFADVLLGPN